MAEAVPYARVAFEPDGSAYERCPVCGEHCPIKTDGDGETTAGSYAKHYETEHGDGS